MPAPGLFAGSCTTARFKAWRAQELGPRVQGTHVAGRDNAPFHQSALTPALSAGTGATLLFLPPYAPDLTPIAHDFATLKRQREYREQEALDTLLKTYQSFEA